LTAIPPPDDLTVRQGLAALYLLQQWEVVHARPLPKPYAPGLFYKSVLPVVHGLTNTSPKTALKHFNTRQCYVCDSPTVTIDHLFATAAGGPDTMQNYGLLCGRHNSSKGSKDLLSWWVDSGFDPCALPRQVVCLYTRVLWQTLPLVRLQAPASVALQRMVQARAGHLPGLDYLEALYGAMYAVCWRATWERQHTETP
jgi:hypothetical protein